MKRVIFWAGVLISVLMLTLAVRGLKLDEFAKDLQQANLFWLLPGIAAYFVAVGVRAWRWQFMLRPVQPVSISTAYLIIVIGYMGNNIYPARIGEFIRAFVLRKKTGLPIASTISTVLLERILDALVMAAFVLIGLPRVPSLPDTVRTGVLAAAAIFSVAAAIFVALASQPQWAISVLGAFSSRLLPPRLRDLVMGLVNRFIEGAASMRHPSGVLALLLSSVLVWLIETVKYWCIGQGFGMPSAFVDYMLVNGVSNLFTIIPSPPGAIGTFDAGSIWALEALGIPKALASAYTIVLHVALWLPVTALGALFMLREGLGWRDLQKLEQSTATPHADNAQ